MKAHRIQIVTQDDCIYENNENIAFIVQVEEPESEN